jgi:hypothetical protein
MITPHKTNRKSLAHKTAAKWVVRYEYHAWDAPLCGSNWMWHHPITLFLRWIWFISHELRNDFVTSSYRTANKEWEWGCSAWYRLSKNEEISWQPSAQLIKIPFPTLSLEQGLCQRLWFY